MIPESRGEGGGRRGSPAEEDHRHELVESAKAMEQQRDIAHAGNHQGLNVWDQLLRGKWSIVRRAVTGESNKVMAIELELHASTIANLLARALRKLGLERRVQLPLLHRLLVAERWRGTVRWEPAPPDPTTPGWGSVHKMCAALLQLAVATTFAAAAGGELVLPKPSAPAPVVIEEVGPSPVYYRLPRDTVLFGGRSGLGASRRLAGEGRAGASAFALELHLAAALAPRRASRFALLTEAGYSFSSYGAHLAGLGAGPLLRGLGQEGPFSATEVSLVTPISLAVLPHLVAGTLQGEGALGIRGTLLVCFGLYGLALSYQRAWVGERAVDEVRLMLTSLSFGWGQQ